jgi:hypothetical protein
MVVVAMRSAYIESSYPSAQSKSDNGGNGTSTWSSAMMLPMGDNGDSTANWKKQSGVYSYNPSSPAGLFSAAKRAQSTPWVVGLLYFFVAASWLSNGRPSRDANRLLQSMQDEINALQAQMSETSESTGRSKEELFRTNKRLSQLKIQVYAQEQELNKVEEDNQKKIIEQQQQLANRQNNPTIQWVDQRISAMNTTITSLQSYIRENSKQAVLARYVPLTRLHSIICCIVSILFSHSALSRLPLHCLQIWTWTTQSQIHR